jgi:hypothetical protein
MTKYILLGYENKVGKDYVANRLVKFLSSKGYKVKKISLADKLKRIYCNFRDMDLPVLEALKDSYLPYSDITYRAELINLSKAIIKEEANFFNKEAIDDSYDVIIISDFRYLNTYTYLKNKGYDIYTVKIIGNTTDTNQVSELKDFNFDFYYVNNIKPLKYSFTKRILKYLNKKGNINDKDRYRLSKGSY